MKDVLIKIAKVADSIAVAVAIISALTDAVSVFVKKIKELQSGNDTKEIKE